MKKVFICAILALLPFVAFCQYNISGNVVSSKTNEKLPGAHLILENTFYSTISDQDGNFNFNKLKKGIYLLKISFLGFEHFQKEIKLDNNVELSVKLIPKAIMEEEVIIRATRAHAKSPTTFKNISRKELKEVNLGQDLPYMIENTPGVVVTSNAGTGIGYTGIRIRGTDISRINVTINGIPLNDPESNGVYWVDMPDFASSVDNIQIQRGVGTSTNGAAAFGASINIQTQKLKPEPYATINSSAGSYKTFRNNLSFGTGLITGKWSVDGRLSKITSDGYIDRAWSDLKSFFVSGSYFGDKSMFKLNIFSGKEKTYQAWSGVPGDSLATNRTYNPEGQYIDENGKIVYYDNQTDNYQQDHYQLFYSGMLNKNLNINASLFYIKGYGYYESYKQDQKFSKYGLNNVIIGGDTIRKTDLIRRKYLNNDFYGLTFSAFYDSFKKLTASFGGSYNYYDGAHYGKIIWAEYASNGNINRRWYNNDGVKKQSNIYGKLNYQLTKPLNIYVDLQLRTVNYKIEGTHDDLRDLSQKHNFVFFNPKFGAFYEFNQNHSAYFSFAIANREPSRNDYRDADENHKPESEKLTDYELGYSFKSGRFRFNANFYYMNYKDQLVLTGKINNTGNPIMINVPKSYRTGIELAAGLKITNIIKWELNGAFSRNKIKDFTEYVDNWSPPYEQISKNLGETDLSFSPGILANSIISVEPVKNLILKLVSKYVGKQYIDNTSNNNRKLAPYFVNNIRINYSFTTNLIKEIDLFLLVNNIFSEKYESNAWIYRYYYEGKEYELDGYFPQAPVNFLVGVSLKF